MSGTASISSAGSVASLRRGRQKATRADSIVACSDQVVRVSLMLVILVVPLTMAGIQQSGVAFFVATSFVMSVAWAVRQFIGTESGSPFSVAIAIGFFAIAAVCLQLVSLPDSVLMRLSPFTEQFFGNADKSTMQPALTSISLTPEFTRSALILLIGYVAFFTTVHQTLRDRASIDFVLRYIALSALIMAVIGLAQMVAGNGDFLWIVEHPLRSANGAAKGTFTNRNHFAHYLALGVGPIFWLWLNSGLHDGRSMRGRVSNRGFGIRRDTDDIQLWMSVGLGVVLLAGILSLSRGGIAVLLVAICVSLVGVGSQSKNLFRSCFSWRVFFRLSVPVVLLTIFGVAAFGTEILESRWTQLTQAQSFQDISKGRYLLWASLLKAVPWFWPLGSGVGSHAEVYPTWMEVDFGKRFSHAESGYLQVLVETGVFGLTLVLAAILTIVFWGIRIWSAGEKKDKQRTAILAAGLIVSILHSVADFVWYVPACMIVTLLLAACLCRQYQLVVIDRNEKDDVYVRDPIRSRWPTIWASIVLIALIPTARLSAGTLIANAKAEPEWLRYRRLAIDASTDASFGSLESVDQRLGAMIQHLESCLDVDSSNSRTRSELAGLYLRRFEMNQLATDNPVSVTEIRNTVTHAGFEGPRDVAEWLKRAFGDNVLDLYRSLSMARTALVGQPLRGENYLILSQLSFLLQVEDDDPDRLLQQALRIRPYQTEVLYLAGLREAERGELDAAISFWLRPFGKDREFSKIIISSLASHLPPNEIITRLPLDAAGTTALFQYYAGINDTNAQDYVASWYRDEFSRLVEERDPTQSLFWYQSYELLKVAGDTEKALYCLACICRERPADLYARKRYAFALLDAQAVSAARKELEWCRLRNPDDREIADALKTLSETPKEELAIDAR